MHDLIIRPEIARDAREIHALTKAAFAPMHFSDGSEPDIIDRLRRDGDLTLSLVAMRGQELVGHVAFSPATVGTESQGWHALGPVSADPELQKQGIGKAIVTDGLSRLSNLGAKGCVLIGNPRYYSRFGFSGDGRVSYKDTPPGVAQWLAFGAALPCGEITFARAFG